MIFGKPQRGIPQKAQVGVKRAECEEIGKKIHVAETKSLLHTSFPFGDIVFHSFFYFYVVFRLREAPIAELE
jgi:hypothetical protein